MRLGARQCIIGGAIAAGDFAGASIRYAVRLPMSSHNPAPLIRVNRYVWLLLAVVVIALLLYQIRGALIPFIVGGALAYVFEPAVSWMERRAPWMSDKPELRRIILIFIVFVVGALVATGVLFLVIPPIVAEFRVFIDALPELIRQSRGAVEGWNARFSENVPVEMRAFVQNTLEGFGAMMVDGARNFAGRTLSVVSRTLTVILGLAAAPLFIFYALKDRERLVEGMVGLFPPNPRPHARNILFILNGVFSSYVRAQLLLGVVVGVMVFVCLSILRVPFAPILGLVAGIFELVPIIGPWLGAIPGIIVVLATAPDKLVWVALVYLGVQLLENSLLVPRIQSRALNVHPIMIMVVLIVGSEVAGLWGVILGPPLTAASKEVFMYFLRQWREDLQPAEEAGAQADADVSGDDGAEVGGQA